MYASILLDNNKRDSKVHAFNWIKTRRNAEKIAVGKGLINTIEKAPKSRNIDPN